MSEKSVVGFKKTSIGYIPNDWEIQKLSDIIESLDAGVSVNSENRPAKENEFGILKTSAVYSGRFLPNENKVVKFSEIGRVKLNPIKDAIIISRMNTPELVGEIAYVDKSYDNLFLPDRLWQTRYKGRVSGKWLSYLLTLPNLRGQIRNIATGTSNSMKNISKKSFLSIEIPSLKYEEQQKIASVLSTWDKAIELKEELIEQKKKQKKGIMQKLLTGKVRLPGFNGNWKTTSFKDIFDTVTDYVANGSFATIRENVKYFSQEEYAILLRTQDFNNNFKGPFVYVDKHAYQFLSKSVLFPGDIVISNVGAVGSTYKVPKLDKPLSLAPNAILVRSKKNDLEFLYQFLNSQFGKVKMESITTITAQPKFNKTDFKGLTMEMPPLLEQQEIAKILLNFDKNITLLTKEVEKLKLQKKGLMQKLLTGKTRVKV